MSLHKKIERTKAKSCSVRDMRKLLFELTDEKRWLEDEKYQAFVKLRKSKIVGNEKTGEAGWLKDWNIDRLEREARLPDLVDVVAEDLRKWITAQEDAWYNGVWITYPVLCRWQVYQELGLRTKKQQRRERLGSNKPSNTSGSSPVVIQDSAGDSDLAGTATKALKALEPPEMYDPVRDYRS